MAKMKAALLWRASLLATIAYVAAAGHISPRPSLSFSPNTPYHAVVEPPPRNKTCFIESHGDGKTDDSPCILNAFRECNNGGRAVFRQDQTYFIGTAMDWTFLNHIDIGKPNTQQSFITYGAYSLDWLSADIQGRIVFGTNTTYWQANSFRFGFQNVTSFFKLGGNDVWIYGGE